jgi:hypothetical protein
MSYKLIVKHPIFGQSNSIIRILDGASIPFDLANTDYQEYLKWLEAGNTPLPADETIADEISE